MSLENTINIYENMHRMFSTTEVVCIYIGIMVYGCIILYVLRNRE